METFEPPAAQLPGERRKLGLTSILWEGLLKKKLFIVYLERTPVWLMYEMKYKGKWLINAICSKIKVILGLCVQTLPPDKSPNNEAT